MGLGARHWEVRAHAADFWPDARGQALVVRLPDDFGDPLADLAHLFGPHAARGGGGRPDTDAASHRRRLLIEGWAQ